MTTTPQESLSKTLEDARNTVLWLEHRLPNGYGEVPHVKRTLASLDAALSQQAAQEPQPVAWVRFRSDGGIEGPILDSALDDIRRKSGAWTALYAAAPVNPAEQEKAECPGCNGRGLIGGWAGAGSGYETDDCPLCTESSQQAPSTAAQEQPEYRTRYILQRKSVLSHWEDETPGHQRIEDSLACVKFCKPTKDRPLRIMEIRERVAMDQAAIDAALAHKGAQGDKA